MAYSTYYSIDIQVLKLIWWLTLYGLSVQVSCLMVHRIVPPSCCMYFRGRTAVCTPCTSEGSALRSTYNPRSVQIPHTVKTLRQLLHVQCTCVYTLVENCMFVHVRTYCMHVYAYTCIYRYMYVYMTYMYMRTLQNKCTM